MIYNSKKIFQNRCFCG